MAKVVKISLNQVKKIIHEQIEEQNFLKMNDKQKKKFLLEKAEKVLNTLNELESSSWFDDKKSEENSYQSSELPAEQTESETQGTQELSMGTTEKRVSRILDRATLPIRLKDDCVNTMKTLLSNADADLSSLNNEHGNIASVIKSVSALLIYMSALPALFNFRKLQNLANSIKNSNNSTKANELIKKELQSLVDALEQMKLSQIGTYLKSNHGDY